jgi:hypothetical protein
MLSCVPQSTGGSPAPAFGRRGSEGVFGRDRSASPFARNAGSSSSITGMSRPPRPTERAPPPPAPAAGVAHADDAEPAYADDRWFRRHASDEERGVGEKGYYGVSPEDEQAGLGALDGEYMTFQTAYSRPGSPLKHSRPGSPSKGKRSPETLPSSKRFGS